MRFGKGGDWYGEQFIFDGDRTSFDTATSSHTRSVFAQFVSSQDFILKEGLLGGEFSTAWALQHLDETHAKLQLLGNKKIGGRELIGVQYYSKSGTDMQVKLYFDPETYHHVMTVYEIEIPAGNAVQITGGAFLHDTRYTIEERFSGFQAVDGLTLPSRYQLQFTQELQNGNTRVYDWDMTSDQIRQNLSLDSANFRLR